MKFGRVPVLESEGAILASSLKVLGKKWKKGRKLSRFDVEVLIDQGHQSIVVARLEDDDVDENTAAEAIARVIAGDGLEIRKAATGRCNLYAKHRGLFVVSSESINATNCVNEAFTIATLPSHSYVFAGKLVVSVKVIPYGVSRTSLDECITEANYGPPTANVFAYRKMSIGLIQTTTEWLSSNLLEKGEALLRSRANEVESEITVSETCEHHEDAVKFRLLEYYKKDLDMIFVLGASAIQDRCDVVPQGVVASGARIQHFGMPVDPGNLLLMAKHRSTHVIGLPGCVRSPKRNGFDFVFERLAAGIEVLPQDIMYMGVGGLVTESVQRPERRVTGTLSTNVEKPRVAAIVLAAGRSARMGEQTKLFLKIKDCSMLQQVVRNLESSLVERIFVVTGHERERVREELSDAKVTFVHNRDYAKGLSTSLRCALAQLPKKYDAALVCLGDMPYVNGKQIDGLIDAFSPATEKSICVPTYQGKRGNPVLWSRRFFQEIMEVQGDVGARHLIGEYEDLVVEVEVDNVGVMTDIDTPQAYAAISAANSASEADLQGS